MVTADAYLLRLPHQTVGPLAVSDLVKKPTPGALWRSLGEDWRRERMREYAFGRLWRRG